MIQISTCGGKDFLTQVTYGVKPKSIYISEAAFSIQQMGLSNQKKYFWYLRDYMCKDREWSYAKMVLRKLFIINPDGSRSTIMQEDMTVSKKTLGIHDLLAGGNEGHLKHIQEKDSRWTSRMTNGHLPHHMAWVVYRHQLWLGLQYGLGSMINDIEEAENALQESNYMMHNILGVACIVTKGPRKLHTTFGGFGLFSIPTEQLICQIYMLLQHYHTSTNLSRKLDASLRNFQLQLGTPHNPLTLDYDKWGHLAPLSWVKML
jgi:hypothetical protein